MKKSIKNFIKALPIRLLVLISIFIATNSYYGEEASKNVAKFIYNQQQELILKLKEKELNKIKESTIEISVTIGKSKISGTGLAIKYRNKPLILTNAHVCLSNYFDYINLLDEDYNYTDKTIDFAFYSPKWDIVVGEKRKVTELIFDIKKDICAIPVNELNLSDYSFLKISDKEKFITSYLMQNVPSTLLYSTFNFSETESSFGRETYVSPEIITGDYQNHYEHKTTEMTASFSIKKGEKLKAILEENGKQYANYFYLIKKNENNDLEEDTYRFRFEREEYMLTTMHTVPGDSGSSIFNENFEFQGLVFGTQLEFDPRDSKKFKEKKKKLERKDYKVDKGMMVHKQHVFDLLDKNI